MVDDNPMQQFAESMWQLFQALTHAGFEREDARQIVTSAIMSMLNSMVVKGNRV